MEASKRPAAQPSSDKGGGGKEQMVDSSDEEVLAEAAPKRPAAVEPPAPPAPVPIAWKTDNALVGRQVRTFESTRGGGLGDAEAWRVVDGTITGHSPAAEDVVDSAAVWRIVATDARSSRASHDEERPEQVLTLEEIVQALAAHERQLDVPWSVHVKVSSWTSDEAVDPEVWTHGRWVTYATDENETPRSIAARCSYDHMKCALGPHAPSFPT